MKRPAALSAGLAVLAACADPTDVSVAPSFAAGGIAAVQVTTSATSGPGSFSQAVVDANADPAITGIEFARGLGNIALSSTVTYSGTQALQIDGNGAVLDGTGLASRATAFLANGGANLSLRNLTIEGAPGPGLTVAVPGTASGTIEITLDQVGA